MPLLKKLFGKIKKDVGKVGGAVKKIAKPGMKKEGSIGPSDDMMSKLSEPRQAMRNTGKMLRTAMRK